MVDIILWLFAATAIAALFYRLSRINLSAFCFMDGVLIGSGYYLLAPLLIAMISGSLSAQFILVPAYIPMADAATTLNILGCVILTCLLHAVLQQRTTALRTGFILPNNIPLLKYSIVGYFSLTIFSFVQTGVSSGGHWFYSVHETLTTSGSALIIRHIQGTFRTAIFGLILYRWRSGQLPALQGFAIGGGVMILDIFMTFNRITGVYLLILALLLLARNRIGQVGLAAAVLTITPPLSNAWTMFRSLISVYGYNVQGLQRAASDALRYTGDARLNWADQLNGVFESLNLTVVNYIVKYAGDQLPVMWGATFLLRPATAFLPALIWPGRPPAYGFILGKTINGNDRLSMNSTLLGEAFGNFLYAWPAALVLVLVIYHFAFRRLGRCHPAVGCAAGFIGFGMWRLDSSFAVIALIVLALCLAAAKALLATKSASERR